ncbi:MAG: ABC transporter ATP-binding protein [Chloroflexota bacterium]|nr:ABC transporter ATP-binding protein [Chloroflexota bacterium]
MPDYMIELRDVTKQYGSLVANDHINLSIRRGELMTLLGPSGCGKTTALRCITGHNIPDEGQVLIDGQDVTAVPTHKRELGMVFQNFALFPHMTVFENVEFPLMIRRMDKAERREMVMEALRLIRMEEYADHYPRHISGGQQQRVGLARALVYRPKVLLLDEPLSNLDAKLREEMRFEIRDLIDRLGITAVYVTHDQAEALALSDRVAVMSAGRIEQVGTPDEIYDCPQSRFVADFIGLSDFIEGTVSAVQPELATALIRVKGLEILIPATPEMVPAQSVLLFIRPNNVELLPASHQDATNVFPGVVQKMTYLGDRADYRIAVGDGLQLRVQTDGKVRFGEEESVKVHLPVPLCRVIVAD